MDDWLWSYLGFLDQGIQEGRSCLRRRKHRINGPSLAGGTPRWWTCSWVLYNPQHSRPDFWFQMCLRVLSAVLITHLVCFYLFTESSPELWWARRYIVSSGKSVCIWSLFEVYTVCFCWTDNRGNSRGGQACSRHAPEESWDGPPFWLFYCPSRSLSLSLSLPLKKINNCVTSFYTND